MNLVRQAVKHVMTACLPRERLIAHGPKSNSGKSKIALTFDDGPHPDVTPPLLDLLDRHQLRATFYVIGNLAERRPDLIRRIAAAGHEIGNHTYSHSEPGKTSAWQFLEEIRRTDELIASLTGQPVKTVRPPKGELSWRKFYGLWKRGKTVCLWNIDPKDYQMTSPDQMTTWVSTYSPTDGDILLLHDKFPLASHAIDHMASRGLFEQTETVTVSQWLSGRAKGTKHANHC